MVGAFCFARRLDSGNIHNTPHGSELNHKLQGDRTGEIPHSTGLNKGRGYNQSLLTPKYYMELLLNRKTSQIPLSGVLVPPPASVSALDRAIPAGQLVLLAQTATRSLQSQILWGI